MKEHPPNSQSVNELLADTPAWTCIHPPTSMTCSSQPFPCLTVKRPTHTEKEQAAHCAF